MIMNLPLELYDNIFTYVGREYLVPLRLVCMEWYKLIVSILGSRLFLCLDGNEQHLPTTLSVCKTYIKTLVVDFVKPDQGRSSSETSSLKKPNFDESSSEHNNMICSSVERTFVFIESLEISGCLNNSSFGQLINTFGNLIRLKIDLSKMYYVYDNSNQTLSRFLINRLSKSTIKELSLLRCGIGWTEIRKLTNTYTTMSKLEYVSDSNLGIISFSYDFNNNCFLSVGIMFNSDEAVMMNLSPNKKNRPTNHISNILKTNFDEFGFFDFNDFTRRLKIFYSIESMKMDVTYCFEPSYHSFLEDIKEWTILGDFISDVSLENLSKIESLNIQINTPYPQKYKKLFLNSYSNLKYLFLSGTSEIFPGDVGLPQLLQVSSSVSPGIEFWKMFATNCPKLVKISTGDFVNQLLPLKKEFPDLIVSAYRDPDYMESSIFKIDLYARGREN